MINLSQLAREDNNYSLMEKIRSLLEFDIYFAENIGDYKESVNKIKTPWYKTCNRSVSVFGVIIRNVEIDLVEENLDRKLRKFMVHDATGSSIMDWYDRNGEFGVYKTFEEVQQEQGLRKKDWVYEVFIKCMNIGCDDILCCDDILYGYKSLYRHSHYISIIEDVKKHNFTRKLVEEESLLDRLGGFIPQINIQPQEI